jgi:hypothetical protein
MSDLYEIGNPSDRYTIKHPNREAVCIAVALLGQGQYPLEELRPYDGDERFEMPLFLFGGSEEWFKESFNHTLKESIDHNLKDVIEALDSVLIGDREVFDLAVVEMDEEAKERFEKKWHDKHRSSMNDIGKYAKSLARNLSRRMETDNGDTAES